MLTSTELKQMGAKANMRLDQKTIDQVLAAVRRGKLPNKGNAQLSCDTDDLKEYMKTCGLEAWHSHFVKHTCVLLKFLFPRTVVPFLKFDQSCCNL